MIINSEFETQCFKLYVDMRGSQEDWPPTKEHKDDWIPDELNERLAQAGLVGSNNIKCKVFSVFNVAKVRRHTREDQKRIIDNKKLTGFPPRLPKWAMSSG